MTEPEGVGTQAFKYDVAISLLGQDAALAERLHDALAPLEVFVFTRRQPDLAGTNLVETFSETFREHAQLAVILHRARWGETDYTDLESLAIQQRGLRTRWRSVLLVKLDDAPTPSWFHADVLGYLEHPRYPFAEIVGAVRAQAERLGAVAREETPQEFVERLARGQADAAERRRIEESEAGMRAVTNEVAQLFGAIAHGGETAREQLAPLNPFVERQPGFVALAARTGTLWVSWDTQWSNSLDGSALTARLFDGYAEVPGYRVARKPRLVTHTSWRPRLDADRVWRWVRTSPPAAHDTAALAQLLLRELFALLFTDRSPGASSRTVPSARSIVVDPDAYADY
jgi:hypothetical protein